MSEHLKESERRERDHEQINENLRLLELCRTDPAWALARIQAAERAEARVEKLGRVVWAVAEELDGEASVSARPGQFDKLEELANQLRAALDTGEGERDE